MNEFMILKTMNVLYVEDDHEQATSLQKTLQIMCSNVYIALYSEKALEILENESIDILLLDINLGGSNGIDIAKKVRIRHSKMPIVIISGCTETNELLEAACRLNLIDFLQKPYDLKQLMDAFTRCIENLKENGSLFYPLSNSVSYSFHQKCLIQNGEMVHLTHNEIKILELLISHKGNIVSYSMFYNIIPEVTSDSALKNIILRLRKKFDSLNCIRNLSKVGYILLPEIN